MAVKKKTTTKKNPSEIPEDIHLKTGKPKKKAGRPRVEIDLNEAEKLGSLHCTYEECSAWLDIPASTLASREDFANAYRKGKEKGKISLRRLNIQHAQTNTAMAIFLSKNLLGMRDTPEQTEPQTKINVTFKPHRLAEKDD